MKSTTEETIKLKMLKNKSMRFGWVPLSFLTTIRLKADISDDIDTNVTPNNLFERRGVFSAYIESVNVTKTKEVMSEIMLLVTSTSD